MQQPQQERSPTEFLSNVIGILSCLDGYMNIALEQTEEWVNGQLKNKYGDAFIRENNVLYISADKTRKREPLNIQ
ncbi:U6 snRNA-associated Sm-like protein LSm6 [Gigaspora rosea]|uniref:U6 snRNA-associated Sm-like protein LSm6 n=1 Tax=Gigaspora rosea TaxID=44941 RepID=A0A397W3W4_9GLOM|nr:U6 snRNA-associated Sm-like protein LSm6 [Gigaspora rosea]